MSDTINVLVVDDQALVRAGFAMILETEPGIEVVGEAADGDEAFALAQELMPDVVLMDIRMPKVDGLEATRRIRNELADPPRVLMLTTFDLDEYVYDALRNGASGFLLKDTPPEDLVAAIRVIAQGEALLAPSVTTRLINEFAPPPARPSPHPRLNDLTERETEVLRHLARGMSNSEVANALFVTEATVKSHISHILTKLALRDRVQAVVVAYESGLVTPGGS
jgi:DNA-binding NarL/FixJ family response regulator